ncbi:hypothetical protein [Neptunomonas sp. XY-337]|uniref:hypothetical protein n=1 Tax=Neptunomonas sp. XY-337 TaxID=2561897 RepID=UPI0010A9DB44|nr:hypothetical protein [Neptunomonas sp. XY-337]
MSATLETIIDSLKNGEFVLTILIILISLIVNYEKIILIIENRNKARVRKLLEAIECQSAKGVTKEYLIEELANEQFKVATGIGAERELREAMILLHRSMEGELPFKYFKRALPHLSLKEGEIEVTISKLDSVNFWFNLLVGILLSVAGLVLMILPTQVNLTFPSNTITITHLIALFSLGVAYMALSVFLISQVMPVAAAKKLKHRLSSQFQ